MFKTILVPADLSERNGPAIVTAADLARSSGGRVILLHVIELIPGLAVDEEREFYGKLEQAAGTHLKKLAAGLAQRGVPHSAAVLFGNRAYEVVVAYAQEAGADLIVLASHRVDLAHPIAGFGTTSYKIGILSQCPVLLVK